MLKVSVSGVRGTVPDDFNPLIVMRYTSAFARIIDGKKILLARDTRPHGPLFYDIVSSTLRMAGKDVYSIGIAPTPTAQFISRKMNMDGGIILTASHNPENWNALKLSAGGGRFLFRDELERLLSHLDDYRWVVPWGERVEIEDAVERHVEAVVESGYVERGHVRVVADCVNGAMYRALPLVLERLGAEVRKVYCEPSGKFERNPEPRREYLRHLEVFLNDEFALAFATDPDGDRVVVGVKGHGMLSEEMTVALSVDYLLNFVRGDVVVNYSTSILVEFVARRHGVRVIRAPVGEANVLRRMEEVGSPIGGEGNGGLIFPEVNATRDGILASAVLYSSYVSGRLMDTLGSLPETYMLKEKVEGGSVEEVLEKFRPLVEGFELTTEDGYYFRRGNSWLHIRPSNTEPIVRIYAESTDRSFVDSVRELLKGAS